MFSQFSAIVIEGNPLARSTLVRMLSEMGFESVAQVSKPKDALKRLESQQYDFIFCEYYFDGSPYTGQVFVDDLRNSNLLPLSTAFIMVTSEASPTKVSEAAESALDNYLLKPFNFNDLQARLTEVRTRKSEFQRVYAEIALNEFTAAAELCEAMVARKTKYWVHAARIAAELNLREGDFAAATRMYDAIAKTTAVPWAKLGLARVNLENGEVVRATRALESLVTESPGYADAYDVMGRAFMLQGELGRAMEIYQKAVSLTPSSLTRLQKLGAIAFLQADSASAEVALERAFRIGAGSRMYDYQSLVLLSFLRHDNKRDPKFIHTAWSLIRAQLEQAPGSFRLQAMLEALAVLAALQSRQVSHAVDGITALAAKLKAPEFDFEMACNFLGLLSRMGATEVKLAEEATWVQVLAARFCTNKTATEILSKCVPVGSPYLQVFEKNLTHVNKTAQNALTKGLSGQCDEAVRDLLDVGRATLNARVLEVASLVTEKYKNALLGYAELSIDIGAMRKQYCSFGTQVGLTTPSRRKPAKLVAQVA